MYNKEKIPRRSVIGRMGLIGTSAAIGTTLSSRDVNAIHKVTSTTATALALIGDESHNSDYIRSGLNSTLVNDAGLSIDFTDEEKLLSYENLQHYKILIIFRDGLRFPNGYYDPISRDEVVSDPPIQKKIGGGRVGWMTPEQGRGLKRWVQEGGSLWAWHNNSQLSLMNKDYRDVEGAIYTGHPPIRPFKVKIVNHDHPITKGVKDFIVTDEQHYVTYDKETKYVLARSVNEDGLDYTDHTGRKSNSCESVWAYDYAKGRVCFMGPGHMVSALWNPEYEKMQKNAVRWLLKET